MSDPTKPGKPAKPREDFPLFPHQSGRWAKKVRAMTGKPGGEMRYFGQWSDDPKGEKALALWLEQKDELIAGRMPREKGTGGRTLQEIVNHFMEAKENSQRAGELSDRSLADYYDSCQRVIKHFGETRLVSDLLPADFGKLRAELAITRGPVTLGNEIQRIRTMFKHAFDNDLIPAPVKMGSMFKKPSKGTVRVHKAEQKEKHGSKMFAAEEIRALLKASKGDAPMTAMILLGINAGWGNKDVAGVRASHFDLKAGIATYSRAKTGVERKVTLWPETVKAVREAIQTRPAAKVAADADLVFITRWGNPWRVSIAPVVPMSDRGEGEEEPSKEQRWKVSRSETDSVGLEFGKLLRKVTVKRDGKPMALKRLGINFYALRHTFKTIGEGAGDVPAVDRIMGHEDSEDVGTHYREWVEDDQRGCPRLRKVTEHVRAWLFPKGKAKR